MIFNVIYDNQIIHQIDFITEPVIINKRLSRSIKIFSILIVCCIFSILIPVFHFILVPGLAISSFIMAYLRYKESLVVYMKYVTCPSCKSLIDDKTFFRTSEDFSFTATCQKCSSDVKFKTIN